MVAYFCIDSTVVLLLISGAIEHGAIEVRETLPYLLLTIQNGLDRAKIFQKEITDKLPEPTKIKIEQTIVRTTLTTKKTPDTRLRTERGLKNLPDYCDISHQKPNSKNPNRKQCLKYVNQGTKSRT